jgi:hypothetical protein
MRQQVLVLTIVMVFLGVGVLAVSSGYDKSVRDNGDQFVVTNESVTSQTYQVDEFNTDRAFETTVTVYRNDTVTQAYTWYSGNATLDLDYTDTTNTTVTYEYNEPTKAQRLTKTVGTLPLQTSEVIILLLLGAVFVSLFIFLGRL